MIDHHMCPHCRKATLDVDLAMECRGDCPHCGGVLVESLRICVIPKCGNALPITRELPVCRDCGIKIAVLHANDATLWHAVAAEHRRVAEQAADQRRNGDEKTCVVYYVRLGPGRIKIGFTSNLKSRLSALRVHPTALLAWEPGGREVEKRRHQQFATERIDSRLEDFEDSPRLHGWIGELKLANGLPRYATLPDTKRVTRRTA